MKSQTWLKDVLTSIDTPRLLYSAFNCDKEPLLRQLFMEKNRCMVSLITKG